MLFCFTMIGTITINKAIIHTYIHAYIHTYIHAYMHTYSHTYVLSYVPTYMTPLDDRMHNYDNHDQSMDYTLNLWPNVKVLPIIYTIVCFVPELMMVLNLFATRNINRVTHLLIKDTCKIQS